ncbi:hypothetical protein [Janibacter limosus]|uniref:hypothetical protein n=1 Tax=Janibacter limosus TaxID=53458 RepID=UPI00082C36DE|nr:hypothetical protein [Janibacter limosus]
MKRNLLTRTPVIALAMALAAGTAGCTVTSPFQTAKTQSLADGVAVDVESAQVRNLALISGKKGGDATVIGTVENVSGKELTLTVAIPGGSKAEAKIPAHATVGLSDDGLMTLTKVPAPPGDMIDVEVSDGTDSTPVSIPVLDPTGYYEDYAPEGWTPTPTPSESHDSEAEAH